MYKRLIISHLYLTICQYFQKSVSIPIITTFNTFVCSFVFRFNCYLFFSFGRRSIDALPPPTNQKTQIPSKIPVFFSSSNAFKHNYLPFIIPRNRLT